MPKAAGSGSPRRSPRKSAIDDEMFAEMMLNELQSRRAKRVTPPARLSARASSPRVTPTRPAKVKQPRSRVVVATDAPRRSARLRAKKSTK